LLTKAEHLKKATDNENLVIRQDLSDGVCVDWSATFLFYSAVHYVGAYVAGRGITHRMHKTRNSAIGRDHILRTVYNDYRELQNFSRDARYERPSGSFSAADIGYLQGCLGNVKTAILPML
jgi:hypothetical protein